MTKKLKIYLAQVNTSVGDLDKNTQIILEEFKKAQKDNCDLVVFPESTICGYPCDDLWKKSYFSLAIEDKIGELITASKNSKTAILFGAPIVDFDKNKKEIIKNCAIFIENGKVEKVVTKKNLPNDGVFDEKRYFKAANNLTNFKFRDVILSILICEDLWDSRNLYLLGEQIFDVMIVMNSSPFSKNKQELRLEKAQKFAEKLEKPLIYLNQIGGQDSLIFDGNSFVLNEKGEEKIKLKEFCEDSKIVEIEKSEKVKLITSHQEKSFEINEKIYSACILGLRDYVAKTGFKKILLGMSGGIDSGLVAAMAADALGSGNVSLFALPSKYNSNQSMIDAKEEAKNLNIELEVISIEEIFGQFDEKLTASQKTLNGLTLENLQSRIRGNILMALSNNSGALLLSTGNKSELAVGYSTIYGDMCGAFNPIKDIYKSEIFELAKWRNSNIPEISLYKKSNIIPQNIIEKEPSAELRENQKDSDSLPDYEILDKILFALIEEEKSISDTISLGFDGEVVKKVAKLFYNSEYKRKQAPLGPKISNMSFDKERRYPIANKFVI